MSFDTCVFLIGLIMIIIILAAFLPFLFLADPSEDNNSNDLKVGDRVAFGGRPYDIWIVESIDKENNWCVVISEPPSINAEDELNKIIHLESNSYLLGQKTLQEVVEGTIEEINAIVNKVLEQSDQKK
jgi:hypothetical protein